MLGPFRFIVRAIVKYADDHAGQYAGNVAFFGLLSFLPFLIFLTALAGLFSDTIAAQRFIQFVFENTPPQTADALRPIIDRVASQSSGSLLTISILGAMWTSGGAVEALRAGLNRAYGFGWGRSFFFHRAQGFLIVWLGALIILLFTTTLIALPDLLGRLPVSDEFVAQINRLLALGRYVVMPAALFFLAVVSYRILPGERVPYRYCFPGAFIAAVLWAGLAWLVEIYARSATQFSVVYGSLGGVIVLMLFMYWSAALYFFGAEINALWRDTTREKEQTGTTR